MDTVGSCPQNDMSKLGEDSKKFYVNCPKREWSAPRHSSDGWWWMDWWELSRSQHQLVHIQLVWGPHACMQHTFQFTSVQSLCHVWHLWPHGLQHARFLCPSLKPKVCSNHVHRFSNAIQPSHPLSSPNPAAFNLSKHQGLSQGVRSSLQVDKMLEFQLQHQTLQWIFRTAFL